MSGRAGLGHCPALGRPLGRGARGDGASRPCESLRLSAEQACLAPPLKTNHRADRIQRRSDFYLASVSLLLNATDPGDGGEYNLAVLADFSGSPGDPISDTAVSGVKLDSDLSTSLEVLTFFPRLLLSSEHPLLVRNVGLAVVVGQLVLFERHFGNWRRGRILSRQQPRWDG